MKKTLSSISALLFLLCTLSYNSCKKDNISLPTVKVFEGAISIEYTTVNVSAEVTDQGGAEVDKRGFIFGKPNGAQDTVKCSGNIGVFSAELTDLGPNTVYTYKAFAHNAGGFAVSNAVSFTTKELDLPTVKTLKTDGETTHTAECSCKVTEEGGATVTKRGVCWRKSQNPTIDNDHAESGEGLGEYQCTLTGLEENTTYYVRAFATNSKGTGYGEELCFTTKDYSLPQVTTAQVTDITSTSAKGGGNVAEDGGTDILERGICWGTSHNPTTENDHAIGNLGTGNFTCEMTNLSPHTKYYVRAYAKNSKGTSYGNELNFTTSAIPPTVTTSSVTDVTTASAKGNGKVADDGGATVTERGFCWSISHNPTISNHHASSGTGTGNFSVDMTNLTHNTTYFARAYATNNQGTTYGEEIEFKTPSISKPTVTTSNVTDITSSSAKGKGNVTSDGGATVTERGICWGTGHNPTISNSHASNGLGTGSYTVNITGLNSNTTYYVRAYATNSQGTSYGEELTFQTEMFTLPTVTTSAVSNITDVSAKVTSKVDNAGSATVTARGVCYGTSQSPSLSNAHYTTDGSGTGSFTSNITGLTPGTTYYVRAYATNSGGTSYGSQLSFTTQSGSWMYYGNGSYLSSWGYTNGGEMQWAVMFPSSMLASYSDASITKIRLYIYESGSYKIKLYRGGTTQPSTLVKTKTFTANEQGWLEVPISSTLNTSQSLWVSISINQNAGEYPASCSAGIGNPNARWVYWGDKGWCDAYSAGWCDRDLTWLIQAFVSNSAKGDSEDEIELPQQPIQHESKKLPKGSCSLNK